MEVGGPIVPDAEDVASITEEHAREMAALLADIAYLQRCQVVGVSPNSGRSPRTEVERERLDARLTKELADARRKYEACFDLYEEAFGEDAARQLVDWIRASCPAMDLTENSKRQTTLFH
jgi:hypothetical protein